MAGNHELTDPEEIKFLYEIAVSTGNQDKITCENPASKNGQVADLLMMQADTLNPALAARWRRRAGATPTIAAMAALHGHAEMTAEARANLRSCDEDFVLDDLAAQKAHEAEQLAAMDRQVEAIQRAREGDAGYEARLKREAAAAAAHEEQVQQSREMQRRVEAIQAQHARNF